MPIYLPYIEEKGRMTRQGETEGLSCFVLVGDIGTFPAGSSACVI